MGGVWVAAGRVPSAGGDGGLHGCGDSCRGRRRRNIGEPFLHERAIDVRRAVRTVVKTGFWGYFSGCARIGVEIVVAKCGNGAILALVRAVFGLMEDCWRCGG